MTRFPRRVRAAVLAGACAVSLTACGSDGGFVVFVNFGSITGDAACDGSNGQFPFEESGGLAVIVVVNDDTNILLASGTPGTYWDLKAGHDAEVCGNEGNGRVHAQQVTLEGRSVVRRRRPTDTEVGDQPGERIGLAITDVEALRGSRGCRDDRASARTVNPADRALTLMSRPDPWDIGSVRDQGTLIRTVA